MPQSNPMTDVELGARMSWNPIKRAATKAATAMGHRMGIFGGGYRSPSVKTAMCETCGGCCWVAYTPSRGFGCGGRLLRYRCGTKEAAGLL